MDKRCATCRWYVSFEGVCFNVVSPYCADFTDSEDCRAEWKARRFADDYEI